MMQLFNTNQIYSRRSLFENWQLQAYEAFASKMSDKDNLFPCIPATQGFHLNHFRYGFVSDPRKDTAVTELAVILKTYSETSRSTGNLSSLVVLFETPEDLRNSFSVTDYEELFWSLLNQLSDQDEKEWPDHIPIDPSENAWEFCYHEEQYFVYCGTPAHVNRQSLHGEVFTLAITPRWVLDEFNTSPISSEKVKQKIRQRLADYDTAPAHPELKKYGQEDNFEWKQYFLRDDHTSLRKCPFHKLWKDKS